MGSSESSILDRGQRVEVLHGSNGSRKHGTMLLLELLRRGLLPESAPFRKNRTAPGSGKDDTTRAHKQATIEERHRERSKHARQRRVRTKFEY